MGNSEAKIEVWAGRGQEHTSDDGAVTVSMTEDHLVVKVKGESHLFALPDLEPDGRQSDDYSPVTTMGTSRFTIGCEQVLEADGFLLSFVDNTANGGDRLMFISGPADDYAFNCEGLGYEYDFCLPRRGEHFHD